MREGHDIHIPFDDHYARSVTYRASGLKQAIEFATLLEQRSFRRIEVFRFPLVNHATSETDHGSALVVDRKHDAIAEAVIAPALFAGDHQPGFSQRIRLIVGKNRFQILPAVGCVAQAVTRGDFAGQSALLQIGDGFVGGFELGLVILGRLEHHVRQVLRSLGLFRAPRIRRLLRHHHADTARQILDRIDVAHALMFHQKTDGAAMRSAAEAMVELLGLADGK